MSNHFNYANLRRCETVHLSIVVRIIVDLIETWIVYTGLPLMLVWLVSIHNILRISTGAQRRDNVIIYI